VLEVTEASDEVVVTVETTADFVGCGSCGTRAVAHDRVPIAVRDLACFGRPARLVWRKRRWRCVDVDCATATWTECSEHVDAQVVLTRRAGASPAARWASWPGRWPPWPPSSACAGGR
jgi:transposase